MVTNHLTYKNQKNLSWLFKDVKYYEQKKVSYVGGSQGLNMRIAKGLYYQIGAFIKETGQKQMKLFMQIQVSY